MYVKLFGQSIFMDYGGHLKFSNKKDISSLLTMKWLHSMFP